MTAPKILIMVLSYNQPPFDELMRAQKETWDSINQPGVTTLYYRGIDIPPGPVSKAPIYFGERIYSWSEELVCACTDKYYYMAAKFSLALNWALADISWDLIFRTNSSSYVNKKRLVEFAATLPREKLYAGKTLVDLNDFSGIAISGAGIWLSRDTAEILQKEIDPEFEQEEDIYCGRILRKHGIVPIADESRFDYPEGMEGRHYTDADVYHIRFKTGDRKKDADNMRLVHKSIINDTAKKV